MSNIVNIISPVPEDSVPMCFQCGQQHRTHAAVELENGEVLGMPCYEELGGDVRAAVALRATRSPEPLEPLRSLLGTEYEEIQKYVDALDDRVDTLSDLEAGYVRLMRWEDIEASRVPHAYDLLAYWMMNKTPEPDKFITGNWLGKEKERIETRVRVTSIHGPYPSEHGDSWLCVMVTVPEGLRCIWWTGDNLAFDVDEEYNIRGTIKKLSVYNGERQTDLTRVKEVQ